MENKRAVGSRYEEEAAAFLQKNGYRILEKNFRNRRGEIDLIAKDGRTLVFVEVGLSGEVRAVSMAAQSVQEARRLGFDRIILPRACMEQIKQPEGVRLVGVSTVRDAMEALG